MLNKVFGGKLFTHLTDLGLILLGAGVHALQLQFDVFIAICEEERTRIEAWLNRDNDMQAVAMGLAQFLTRHNPIGYAWAISIEESHLFLVDFSANNHCQRMLQIAAMPEHKITLSLKRSRGTAFILSLLDHSSPQLLQGLKEANTKAYMLLLFRAIFHLCTEDSHCKDRSNDPLLAQFKPETHKKIRELVEEEEGIDFKKCIFDIRRNPELYKQTHEMLLMTPEEFDAMSIDTLPKNLQTVVKEVKSLAYGELSGHSFLQNCYYPIAHSDPNSD